MQIPKTAKEKIVVALDVANRDRALQLVETLSGLVGMFKIGKQLFTAAGPQLVRDIIAAGEHVFLDLKYHDIPNTVAGASQAAAQLGVAMFNVHALGGAEMMHAASQALQSEAALLPPTAQALNIHSSDQAVSGQPPLPAIRPAILGVTVLTSMNDTSLAEVGIAGTADEVVVRLATLAREAGLDGVVASPREIRLIRERVAATNFIILTPGIRPVWAASGDQKRIATPVEALRDGADYVVIGRAITDGQPSDNAKRILEEIDRC
ncbi:MAG: orotidine 5'-phosphate decarboxylase [Acidobacteria bacterium]|nr:orotidine 5'-phosphate decarboxylase [Acidobacteriota bacterium]